MEQKELQQAAELIWDELNNKYLQVNDEQISDSNDHYGKEYFIESFIANAQKHERVYVYVQKDDNILKVEPMDMLEHDAKMLGMTLPEYERVYMKPYEGSIKLVGVQLILDI